MHRLVIARYNEDLSWLIDVPMNFQIIVYNKGDQITENQIIDRCSAIIPRPNVGRESETYATDMILNQIEDDNFTVFSQGGVHEHSPDFTKILAQTEQWNDVQALSWCWRMDRNIPPLAHLVAKQKTLNGQMRVRPENFSLHLWGPLCFEDQGASGLGTVYRIINNIEEGGNIATHMLYRLQLPHIAQRANLHNVGTFSYGAIFAVKNKLAASLPMQSKEALRAIAIEPVAANGYILERLWLHIFGQEFSVPQ